MLCNMQDPIITWQSTMIVTNKRYPQDNRNLHHQSHQHLCACTEIMKQIRSCLAREAPSAVHSKRH